MGVKHQLSNWTPWSAVIAAGLGLTLSQQGLSTILHFGCTRLTPWNALLLVAPALLVTAVGFALSWPALSADAPARRFSARISVGMAVLFTLPVLLQYAATLALPPCAR